MVAGTAVMRGQPLSKQHTTRTSIKTVVGQERLFRKNFEGKSLWYGDQLVGKMIQKVSKIKNVREETNWKQNTEFFMDGVNLKCLQGTEVEESDGEKHSSKA